MIGLNRNVCASLGGQSRAPLTLTKVRQQFARPVIMDVRQAVTSQLANAFSRVPAGQEIAIAVGSRGIANIAIIVRSIADFLKGKGVIPFIVPAMGSHGGATAEGQQELLASFGIDEQQMGCPIRSSMDVIELPAPGLPFKLFMDAHAYRSVGVILVNRIKPHTDFHGRFESGLAKMAVIGLGKERQAFQMHCFGVHGLRDLVPVAAGHILATGKILGGVAVVENAYDEIALVEAIPAREILNREPQLLKQAHANMPCLPVDDLDLLIVDRLGKNISGTGMDTNIIGRILIPGEPEPVTPRIKSIIVRSLTPESHGNATGMGLADVVTRDFLNDIDWPVTYRNILTSGFLERGKLPIVAETDADAVEIALRATGQSGSTDRVIRIQDTLHLSELYVSRAILEEIKTKEVIEVTSQDGPLLGTDGVCHPF